MVANARRAYARAGSLGEVFNAPILALWIACLLHFLHAYLFMGWGFYW